MALRFATEVILEDASEIGSGIGWTIIDVRI
jgi:hypothetical protein